MKDMEDSFVTAIQEAMKERIAKFAEYEKERLIAEYSKNLRYKMQELVSAVSIEIFHMITMERCGNDLLIKVNMKEQTK